MQRCRCVLQGHSNSASFIGRLPLQLPADRAGHCATAADIQRCAPAHEPLPSPLPCPCSGWRGCPCGGWCPAALCSSGQPSSTCRRCAARCALSEAVCEGACAGTHGVLWRAFCCAMAARGVVPTSDPAAPPAAHTSQSLPAALCMFAMQQLHHRPTHPGLPTHPPPPLADAGLGLLLRGEPDLGVPAPQPLHPGAALPLRQRLAPHALRVPPRGWAGRAGGEGRGPWRQRGRKASSHQQGSLRGCHPIQPRLPPRSPPTLLQARARTLSCGTSATRTSPLTAWPPWKASLAGWQ